MDQSLWTWRASAAALLIVAACGGGDGSGLAGPGGAGEVSATPTPSGPGSTTATPPDPGPAPTDPPGIVDDGIIPADRRTTWNPGIPGGIPSRTAVCATLSAATFGNGSVDAGPAIQKALDDCSPPRGDVVVLGPGVFKTSATLRLEKGVVLRGAGSSGGGHPATTINRSPAGTVVQIGKVSSRATADAGTGTDLTVDAPKGTTTLTLASAGSFAAGDLVQIDAEDDPAVVQNATPYDCPYFKRAPNRSIGQRIEIKSVAGNVLTLSSPLHWTFTKALKAQVAPIAQPITRDAGLEGVRLTGGDHPYDGAGVDVWNAAYSWIKDIETDTMTGMHIVLSGTYRFVVRDSYVHHSGSYGYGVGCYGIVIRFQSADALVENNIARYLNKPILFNASGGGNVIAYNYVDDSWATPGWQEVNIDCHCNFPHMELIEGNYAPHMGMSSTHGNAGYLTFFRNQSTTKFHEITGQTGNVAAIQLDTHAQSMNVVANVLGAPGFGGQYEQSKDDGTCSVPHAFLLGSGFGVQGCSWSSTPSTDPALTTLLRAGNFDYASNGTTWSDGKGARPIAASHYLARKPAFWPSASPWPSNGPDLTPMTGLLPAKQRFDAQLDGK